jgi:serine protease AprX
LEAAPSLTPAQIKALLQQTAVNLGLDPNTQGSGRADAFAAYQAISPQPPTPPPPPGEPQGCLTALLRLLGG